jgi:hypothetical protein
MDLIMGNILNKVEIASFTGHSAFASHIDMNLPHTSKSTHRQAK